MGVWSFRTNSPARSIRNRVLWGAGVASKEWIINRNNCDESAVVNALTLLFIGPHFSFVYFKPTKIPLFFLLVRKSNKDFITFSCLLELIVCSEKRVIDLFPIPVVSWRLHYELQEISSPFLRPPPFPYVTLLLRSPYQKTNRIWSMLRQLWTSISSSLTLVLYVFRDWISLNIVAVIQLQRVDI